MRDYNFYPGPRLLVGSRQSGAAAQALPAGPTLFVTDKEIIRLGLADNWLAELKAAGRHPIVFDGVEADPSRLTLLSAFAAGREAAVGSVVGFGGGSPMDVAKLAAYLLGSGDELDSVWGVEKARGARLPLLLVPTTAGTGSEATQYSVITCEDGEKRAVNARVLVPDIAILDPELTVGLPRGVTAATGLDAIVHAVEAYTSRQKNPLSDMFAREALRLLARHLLRACDEPHDRQARAAMLLGAHLAGLAFANASVAAVHALAYPLGGLHHLPHGVSNALMLRHVMTHNLDAAGQHYSELAEIVDPACIAGTPDERARRLIDTLQNLIVSSGIAPRLRDHGIARDDVARLATEAMKGERMLLQNAAPVGEPDALRLYEAAW